MFKHHKTIVYGAYFFVKFLFLNLGV